MSLNYTVSAFQKDITEEISKTCRFYKFSDNEQVESELCKCIVQYLKSKYLKKYPEVFNVQPLDTIKNILSGVQPVQAVSQTAEQKLRQAHLTEMRKMVSENVELTNKIELISNELIKKKL